MNKQDNARIKKGVYILIIIIMLIILYYFNRRNNRLYKNIEFNKKITIFQTSLIGGKYDLSLKYIEDMSCDKSIPQELIDLIIEQFWYSIGTRYKYQTISREDINNIPERKFYDILIKLVQSDIRNTLTLNIDNITSSIPVIFTSNDLKINASARIADIIATKYPDKVNHLMYSLYELRKTEPHEFNLINLPLKLSIFLYVKDYDSILDIRNNFTIDKNAKLDQDQQILLVSEIAALSMLKKYDEAYKKGKYYLENGLITHKQITYNFNILMKSLKNIVEKTR